MSRTTHRMTGTLTYSSYRAMICRCFHEGNHNYEFYGGNGITVCIFLYQSPLNLVKMIGERPSKIWTLDRINPNLHYSCGTCEECIKNNWPLNIRWATQKEQEHNKNNNTLMTINGVTKTAVEWALEYKYLQENLKNNAS